MRSDKHIPPALWFLFSREAADGTNAVLPRTNKNEKIFQDKVDEML